MSSDNSKNDQRLLELRSAEMYLLDIERRKLREGAYREMTTAALRVADRLLMLASKEGGRLRASPKDFALPAYLEMAEEGLVAMAELSMARQDYKALDALTEALVRVVADQEALEIDHGDEDEEPSEEDGADVDEVDEAGGDVVGEVDLDDMDHQEIHEPASDPQGIDLPPPPPIPAPAVAHEQPELRTPVGPGSVGRIIKNFAPPPTR